MRNTVLRDLKVRFDREKIEFAIPHRVMISSPADPISVPGEPTLPNPPGR
jgi:hypothetical protein